MEEEKKPKKTIIEYIANAIKSIWKFATNTFTIVLFACIVFVVLMVFMREDCIKAIEIIKSIIVEGG